MSTTDNLNEKMETILNSVVRKLSRELSALSYQRDEYKEPRLEKYIQEKIISAAENYFPPHLLFKKDCPYPLVSNNRCDLVLTDNTTGKPVMWCEIKMLKRRDPTQGPSNQLQITSRKAIYSDLIKLGKYFQTEDTDVKNFIVGSFLDPQQLTAEWREKKPVLQQYAALYNSVNPVIRFTYRQEEKSVVNEIIKRLNPVRDERKPPIQEVKFELSRLCKAECGRESSNNYFVLYLFKLIKVQVAP